MRRLIAAVLMILGMSAMQARADAGREPEFDGYCAYSLANGGERKTACEVVWISPEDKLYCFMNEAARNEFVREAQRNLRKAKAFWEDPAYWERLKAEEAS